MYKYKCIKRYFGRIEVGEIVELQEDFEIKGVCNSDGNPFHVLTFYWIHDGDSSNLIIYDNDLHEHFERMI